MPCCGRTLGLVEVPESRRRSTITDKRRSKGDPIQNNRLDNIQAVRKSGNDSDDPVTKIEVIESPRAQSGRFIRDYDRETKSSATENPTSPTPQIRLLSDQQLLDGSGSSDGRERQSSIGWLRRAAGSGRRSRTDSAASARIRGNRDSEEAPAGTGRALFSSFLAKCYSPEVLEFWDQSTKYIRWCKKKTAGDEAKELGRKMIEQYIVRGAPLKLDLGEDVEDPLIDAYKSGNFQPGTFDSARRMLFKLMQGLRMEASVSYGVKSTNATAINAFLEEEERHMHQLMFQRDVHPLLLRLRKSATFGSVSSQKGSGSGILKKTSQVFNDIFSGANHRGSGAPSGTKSPKNSHQPGNHL